MAAESQPFHQINAQQTIEFLKDILERSSSDSKAKVLLNHILICAREDGDFPTSYTLNYIELRGQFGSILNSAAEDAFRKASMDPDAEKAAAAKKAIAETVLALGADTMAPDTRFWWEEKLAFLTD